MSVQYIRTGDYFPDLKLTEETRPIGKWGRMHRDYLRIPPHPVQQLGSVRQSLDISCRHERAGPAALGNPGCPVDIHRGYHGSTESCRFHLLDSADEQHCSQSRSNCPRGVDLQ